MLPEKYSQSVFTASAVAEKMPFTIFKILKQSFNASCDKILQCDCTTLYSVAGHGCIRSSPDHSLFAEVGLACETKYNAGASKSTLLCC